MEDRTQPLIAANGKEDITTVSARTPRADERRQVIAQAATALIAERGFEGLRTRDVAARVGVNIATLHYYFATKEALIAGVADYLSEQFRTVHAPLHTGKGTPRERLRQEFADARYYRTDCPEMWIAIHELTQHAERDAATAGILRRLEHYWYVGIDSILTDGVAAGEFRSDLDLEATTNLFRAFIRGSYLTMRDLYEFDRACMQFERFLLPPAAEESAS